MMQPVRTGRADIHTRAASDGLQAFKDLDLFCIIIITFSQDSYSFLLRTQNRPAVFLHSLKIIINIIAKKPEKVKRLAQIFRLLSGIF